MPDPRTPRRDREPAGAWPDAPEPRTEARPPALVPTAPVATVTTPVPTPVRLETVPVEPLPARAEPLSAVAKPPERSATSAWVEDPWQAVTRRDRDPDSSGRAAQAWATWANATGLQATLFQPAVAPAPAPAVAQPPASMATPPPAAQAAPAAQIAPAPAVPATPAAQAAPPPAALPAAPVALTVWSSGEPWSQPHGPTLRQDVTNIYATQWAAAQAEATSAAQAVAPAEAAPTDPAGDAWTAAVAAAAWDVEPRRAAASRAPSRAMPVVDVLREVADATNDERRAAGRGSWLRDIKAAGLLDSSEVDGRGLELALVDAVRAPQAATRLVGVVSGKGGVGASTTAMGIAQYLAALRGDRTVLVDAYAGSPSLAARLAGQVAPALTDVAHDPWRYSPVVTDSGLGVVDAPPWWRPDDAQSLCRALRRLSDQHSFTIVDLGNNLALPAQAALSTVDQAVLVTTAEPDAIAATRVALERVADVGPGLETVAIAVVCTRGVAARRVRRVLQGQLSADLARIVVVPYDPALAEGETDLARLRAGTRLAYLTLAAMVSDGR
jgi:MinD-like ATPase involved in chromosome partitioning or flagellar assembly